MRCTSCAKDNDPASAYCAWCGATLPTHGGQPPAAYQPVSYDQPASYGPPPAFEMPTQSGPGWPSGAPYQDPPEGHQAPAVPPPYADNTGPGYPSWMTTAPPTSGPPTSGPPVSGPPVSGAPGVQAYPAAPYDPSAYGQYAPQPQVITNTAPPRRSMVGLVVVVAVIVVIAVGGFAAFTLLDHKKTPPVAAPTTGTTATTAAPEPTATTDHNVTATTAAPDPAAAHNQAATIDTLLTASVSSRKKLNNAIDKVNRCSDLQGAVSDMNAAGQERQSQITSVQQANLSAIPTGSQIRDLLVQALQYSQQADTSYTAWAQGAMDNGCADSDQRDRDYAEAQRLSGLAKSAKSSFLTAWNPVASANGVSARSPDDI